jgi:chemotaxis protein CheD
MAHVMLPDSEGIGSSGGDFHCADTAVSTLIDGLRNGGSSPQELVAKIVGGAQMFSSYENHTSIGSQNISSIKKLLRQSRIPLVGWDVASHHGRSVEFCLASGRVVVKANGITDKEF